MSPRENFQFINSYLRRMGPVVRRHNGFVDKYMGDGIMALFQERPEDALRAALDMRKALKEYNEHRGASGYAPIRMGIGLHHGPLMLGTIGENRRMDSTVISDTVNTASRLEGLTKKFAVDLLVSEETIEALEAGLREEFQFVYVSEETVKGRKKALRVYSVSQPA
jgi:class 3 adenylate cyclase